MRKIIFYELNEVPFRVIDYFVEFSKKSGMKTAFEKLRCEGKSIHTITPDEGHLSPWITWPTLHRGTRNTEHGIYNFGQDLSIPNKEFPPIWEIIGQRFSVGIFGSLHSYPINKDVQFSFCVPDTFAAGSETVPKSVRAFQEFNLKMVDMSGRNVGVRLPIKDALRFLNRSFQLNITPRTFYMLAKQLIRERFNRDLVSRRRTSQMQIGFDVFFGLLRLKKPDYVSFFTNHVASSMHRYWPATFPEDYKKDIWGASWQKRYESEIIYAMREADFQLSTLIDFVENNSDYLLITTSSMGQEAVDVDSRVFTELNIVDRQRFMLFMGVPPDGWELRRNMAPVYTFFVKDEHCQKFVNSLNGLKINSNAVSFKNPTSNVFVIQFGDKNQADSSTSLALFGKKHDLTESGLSNISIQDEAGANAYHVPTGHMIIFDPKIKSRSIGNSQSIKIQTTEIAPTVLKNFGIEIPSYMPEAVTGLL